jgi:hypothetical protein
MSDSISLASFLSIACFIEELELHVSIIMCALLLRCLMHDLLLNYCTSFKELPYHVFCTTLVMILSRPLLIQVFAYINLLPFVFSHVHLKSAQIRQFIKS